MDESGDKFTNLLEDLRKLIDKYGVKSSKLRKEKRSSRKKRDRRDNEKREKKEKVEKYNLKDEKNHRQKKTLSVGGGIISLSHDRVLPASAAHPPSSPSPSSPIPMKSITLLPAEAKTTTTSLPPALTSYLSDISSSKLSIGGGTKTPWSMSFKNKTEGNSTFVNL